MSSSWAHNCALDKETLGFILLNQGETLRTLRFNRYAPSYQSLNWIPKGMIKLYVNGLALQRGVSGRASS